MQMRALAAGLFATALVFPAVPGGGPQQGLAAVPALKIGAAAGTLTLDGKPLPLRHAYALAQPNTFEKTKIDIAVALTEKPLPAETLRNVEKLEDALRNVRGYAFFKINEEGKPIHEVVSHPTLGADTLQMSGFTRAEFTAKVFGKEKDRVEGTLATEQPETFVGHRYELRVDFNAALHQAKKPEPLPDARNGKALPAGGGDPGKAFMALHAAIVQRDLAAVLKLNGAMPDPLPPEDKLKAGLEFMAEMEPDAPKITSGFIRGDRAVLYVTGVKENVAQYGTVEVARRNGAWLVTRQSWSDSAPGGDDGP
jgi:hypothetical protein